MDCIHHNGHITNYLVQYKESGDTQTHTTTGEHAIISNLMSFTTYSIKIAAVNSAGTGEFSSAIMAVTRPSEYSSFFGFKQFCLLLSYSYTCILVMKYVIYVLKCHL